MEARAKDHRYDYIETGSLFSIKKNTQGIVIPSEETRLTMYPMDYEEFRWAMDDTITIPLLQEAFGKRQPLGNAVTRKLMRDFRLYMLVGGMPLHTWPSETSNHNYEIDFLLSRGAKLWPLEVKSSGYRTHKSLDEFYRKFSDRVSNRYLVASSSFSK